jgi:glycosyltransferase involved in cell wall biosynthesis
MNLFGLLPKNTSFLAKPFDALLEEMLGQYNGGTPDVIWFEHSILFPYAKRLRRHFPGARLICNAHNVEYCLQKRVAQIAKAPSIRKWYEMQAEASRRIEKEAFKQCDLIFCCSEEDARLVRQLSPRACVAVIPNGVDTNYFRPATEIGNQRRPDGRSRPRIIFTGAMGYEPNLDAVGYFVQEILPLVRQEEPGCRFCIAGSRAQARFGHLAQADALIEIASDVPDMRPYFEMSDLVVVPLRAGGGTRTKVLEAMAMERAIISTRIGAEGITCVDGKHILLADSPHDFAANVVRLLDDTALRSRIGHQAGVWVRQRYDWTRLCAEAIRGLDRRQTQNSFREEL